MLLFSHFQGPQAPVPKRGVRALRGFYFRVSMHSRIYAKIKSSRIKSVLQYLLFQISVHSSDGTRSAVFGERPVFPAHLRLHHTERYSSGVRHPTDPRLGNYLHLIGRGFPIYGHHVTGFGKWHPTSYRPPIGRLFSSYSAWLSYPWSSCYWLW